MLHPTLERATALTLPVQLRVNGRDVGAETLLSDAGYTLVLQTTIPQPDIPVELHSSYLGFPGAPTRISHLALAGAGHPAHTEQRTTTHAALPVLAARRRCLADHLQRLYDLLAELGHQTSIDPRALDAASELADRA